MTKQTINIGSAPNDGTGDLLRDAFDKVNDNFDEVYSTHTMSTKLTVGNTVSNSTANSTALSVSNSTSNAILSATDLTIGSTVVDANSITTDNVNTGGITASANVTFNGYVIATDDVVITRPDGRIVFSGPNISTSNNFMYLERTPTDIGGGYSVEISSSNNINTYFRYGGTSGTLMIWTVDGSGSILVGNSTVNSSINSTAFNGTANNASNLGGTAAASYVQNTDSRTLSGNLTFSGANTTISSNTLNLGTSTLAANGYSYLPNGLKMNWGYVAANSTDGSVTFASAFGTAIYSIIATSNAVNTSTSVTASNTTSATILTSSATTSNVYYMAIGY